MFSRLVAIALIAALAGCGGLPRPFQGNAGATAARLSQPPPARLAVPEPGAAFLAPDAATAFAGSLAGALANEEVPAIVGAPHKGDWRVLASAAPQGDMIVPRYALEDERGRAQGSVEGAPIPANAWVTATPALLQKAAAEAAPKLAALLTSIDAARRQSDPNSLLNRPARLAFAGVSGAPGDGDTALTKQMQNELLKLGQAVQAPGADADFTLEGHVATAPLPNGQMSVEVQWLVDNARGEERGRVVQLNELQAGALDHFWGDIALVVAREAAGGVRDVIRRQSGLTPPQAPPPQPASEPAAAEPAPPARPAS